MINHINKINLKSTCDKLFVNDINSCHIHDYFYVRNLFLPDKSASIRHPSSHKYVYQIPNELILFHSGTYRKGKRNVIMPTIVIKDATQSIKYI